MIMDGVKLEKKKSKVRPISIKRTTTYHLEQCNGDRRVVVIVW